MIESKRGQLSQLSRDPARSAQTTRRYNDLFIASGNSVDPSYLLPKGPNSSNNRVLRAMTAGVTILGGLTRDETLFEELQRGLPQRILEYREEIRSPLIELDGLVNGQSQFGKSGSRKVHSEAIFAKLKKLLRC